MGWFTRKTEIQEVELTTDPKNPFIGTIEDEGEFITIVHKKADDEDIKSDEDRFVTVVHREATDEVIEEEEENVRTRNKLSIS